MQYHYFKSFTQVLKISYHLVRYVSAAWSHNIVLKFRFQFNNHIVETYGQFSRMNRCKQYVNQDNPKIRKNPRVRFICPTKINSDNSTRDIFYDLIFYKVNKIFIIIPET